MAVLTGEDLIDYSDTDDRAILIDLSDEEIELKTHASSSDLSQSSNKRSAEIMEITASIEPGAKRSKTTPSRSWKDISSQEFVK